jgi:hypothetical protein
MRRCLLYVLVATIAEVALAIPQGNQVPFSITISAAQSVFKADSEVRIRLVFKNTSGEEVPYARSLGTGVEPQGEIFTDVEVRDAKGELAPETKYYRLLRGKPDTSANPPAPEKSGEAPATSGRPEPRPMFRWSFTGVMLRPGEFREEDIVVSKLYDLSQPGRYTISATRRLSDVTTDPNSKLIAKSNTLTITITK